MSAMFLAGRQSSDLPAAAIVAGCALIFTVASFWWLNARQGRLTSYEPHSFAAVANETSTQLRLPLVIYNTGAKPIVVQNLQLRFPDEPDTALRLLWVTTRRYLKPDSGDGHAFAAAFPVGGREAKQLFVEFRAPFPDFVPQARDYKVSVEAKVGHHDDWRHLLTFTWQAAHMVDPGSYITYRNTADDLTTDDVAKSDAALKRLAAKAAAARAS
ncbi:hypothetical protein J7I98_02540 [Streptomyces sp. ISL-98]|uniref:hypothetical protein n=1 Tax=Streptomyces sp. ISL-98 TaxID=2819192 RepID=UPI001BE97965|nr:hypothetical protein [Streptomyces sp. ISL-98]MBT2504789.1 hypothetical protein [Streptomyces sp. ISL-98]